MPNINRAAVLAPGQLRHLLRVTDATSRHPERDVVVLLLGHAAGMRIGEIAQITVADVMFPSGTLRREISLRAAITKGCRQRTAYLTSPKLITAIERYIADRLARCIGVSLQDGFRGLYPDIPLVLSRRGAPFSMNTKRRVLQRGRGEAKEYQACDALQSYVTGLYRAAGLPGSSHSGRRTFAGRILARSGSMERVQQLLGHADLDCASRYVEVRQDVLRRAFAEVI